MNKKLLAIIAFAALSPGAIQTASAIPAFPEVRYSWRIGYHFSAITRADGIHFTVNLDPAAAAALSQGSAEIRLSSPDDWEPLPVITKIKIATESLPGGRKRLDFTVPASLIPRAYLRVYSEPMSVDDGIHQVAGYTFQLSRIQPH
ncbi:MAG TPA: hypothetical protein VG733_13665 [Chthoniobacteraceae bacterium]|nr:hypothetical protein [Chthoniobacteraceae bacterium]